jgi:hypothetical protein
VTLEHSLITSIQNGSSRNHKRTNNSIGRLRARTEQLNHIMSWSRKSQTIRRADQHRWQRRNLVQAVDENHQGESKIQTEQRKGTSFHPQRKTSDGERSTETAAVTGPTRSREKLEIKTRIQQGARKRDPTKHRRQSLGERIRTERTR